MGQEGRFSVAKALRVLLVIVVLFALTYQAVAIVHQFHGALAFYYFHLGLIQMVLMITLAVQAWERGPGGWRLPAMASLTLLFAAGLAASAYLHLSVNEIELRQPFLEPLDMWAGIALVATVTVQVYLVWGRVLAGLIALSILYFTFGYLIPGPFHYASPEAEIIVSYLAGMGGARGVIWGIPLSANTLFLIIVFGGLLKGTRVLELFNEVGKALLNVSRGGICYSAILVSTVIGMVTGQAVANVALSGSVTIPAMQQRGMAGTRAGAVEIVASLGSQLIPPIMGLGGFLMAVNLGVPYVDIATAALVPAFLFVAILFTAAYFMAEAEPDLQIRKETVNRRAILWILPSFVASFGVLLALLYRHYSPGYAAMWAVLLLLVMSVLRPREFRPSWGGLWDGVHYGVVSACNLGLILAGIGIIVQVLVTTGAGFDIGRTIMLVSGGQVFWALLLGMFLALVAGLGLPTPAAYALIAIIMVPFLQDFGLPPLVAHFFGFYFAIFSAVTPPVAVGVMAAIRISGAPFYRTALEAGRMSLTAILIPFAFVAYPSILQFPAFDWQAVVVGGALIVATAFWSAAIYGVFRGRRLKQMERAVLLAVPLAFIALLATGEMLFAFSVFAGLAAFLAWHAYAMKLPEAASPG